MAETNVLVRKLKLCVIDEDENVRKEKYKFIRDAQYRQYQLLNRYMSYLTSEFYQSEMDLKSERYKEAYKLSTKDFIFEHNIEYGKGVDTKSLVKRKVQDDFSTAIKNGFMKGERSINNYKRDFPLMTSGRALKFEYDEENNVTIKWVNKIRFKVILSANKKNVNTELAHTLHKIINGEYKLGQSSLYFDKSNNLILNLSIHFPKKEKASYIRSKFGDVLELTKAKEQFKTRRTRLQQQLRNVKGGKGRKKKLKAFESLSDKERRFTQNYNHQISRRIVDFAKENQCEYINMEYLEGSSFTDKKMLGTWTYYELQQYIKYKAEMEGIKVRFVNPAYTSQTCSKCGYVDSENRLEQEKFVCKKCGNSLNADYNASINIANSTDFIDGKKKNNKKKKVA